VSDGEEFLSDDEKNIEWMRRVYSEKKYWSEELQYGNRWSKDKPIKDYRVPAWTVSRTLTPFLPTTPISTALEIGPGGGRWTAELLRIASRLHLIDVSASALDVCRERFKYYDNVEYHLTDNGDLGFLANRTLDLIFSWGVLVHVSAGLVEEYVSQFHRLLSGSGVAVVQHSNFGTNKRLARSNVTKAWFTEMVERHGLTIKAQIGTSGGFYPEYKDGRERVYLDTLSVLEKTRTAK
jgi:SAM-dependent methyltransferase